MPAPGETQHPQHVIDDALARWSRKEKGWKATDIAKRLKVSRAAVYMWRDKAKKADLERIKLRGMSPQSVEKSEKRDLALENEELRKEVEKLWNKIRELMKKYGEI